MAIDKDYILNQVSRSLDNQFEIYSWKKMIEDSDLTKEEMEWAKKHIRYRAYTY